MSAQPGKPGRPSSYSEKLADSLCEHIAMGKSLVSWCKKAGNPNYSTVMRWLDSMPSFCEKYARARGIQADFIAEQIVDISDEKGSGPEVYQRNKLRIDARKWYASKLAPKKYSDRTEITGANGGAIDHNIQVTFVASKRSDS